MNKKKITSFVVAALVLGTAVTSSVSQIANASIIGDAKGERQMEYLDRGAIGTMTEDGIYISWRYLGTDSSELAFNIYRDGVKLNSTPITDSTNYTDPNGTLNSKYTIKTVQKGFESISSEEVTLTEQNYLSIPLQRPEGGVTLDGEEYTYSANDGSVGDVDGDGEYEYIVKWDPSNSHDNSQAGYTGNVYIDAYKLDGTLLWRIDLGQNIRAGAHYTQFLVYDFDRDGKSEVVCKTADGTVDGQGIVIGDGNVDYRSHNHDDGTLGKILTGPEYLTIFSGETGAALNTTEFSPERGEVTDWGDGYGNRCDRFLAGVAYLDGENPSIIMGRGYYAQTCVSAYDFKNGQLETKWTFKANSEQNSNYMNRGNHQLSIADVDGDGKDEVIYGAMALDDDGSPLYETTFSHGDAMHVSDLIPGHEGLEVFDVHEDKKGASNAEVHDAATGEVLWNIRIADKDVGRGVAADIDPRYEGAEVWASGGVGLWSVADSIVAGDEITPSNPGGTQLATAAENPWVNFAIWWDGDLLRELMDGTSNETITDGSIPSIGKWDYENNKVDTIFTAEDCTTNNSTKRNPVLQADLFGDWREELAVATRDSSELRIYFTTDATDYRIYTLMHDAQYRLSVAWQNTSYNQPPHTSFYLGTGMEMPEQPNIYTVDPKLGTLNSKRVQFKNEFQAKWEALKAKFN